MNEAWDKRLHKLYYEDKYQRGIHSTYHTVNVNRKQKIPRQYVIDWLRQQKSYQINQVPKRPRHVRSIIANKPYHIMQADLIDFTNKPSLQFRYIFMLIDVFSRYLWAIPITAKEASKTEPAFIKCKLPKQPTLLMTDHGGEFMGEFHKYMVDHDTKHIIGIGGRPETQGIVERCNQTIKRQLLRRISIKDGNSGYWHRELPDVVKQYNNSYHSTIKDTPKRVLTYSEKQRKTLTTRLRKRTPATNPIRRQTTLVKGDKVRLRRNKGTMGKYATNNWTEETFTITRVWRSHGPYSTERYSITDKKGISRGSYVREDLLKLYT